MLPNGETVEVLAKPLVAGTVAAADLVEDSGKSGLLEGFVEDVLLDVVGSRGFDSLAVSS